MAEDRHTNHHTTGFVSRWKTVKCNDCREQVAECDSVSRLHVAGELATCSAAGETNIVSIFPHVFLSTSPPEAAGSLRRDQDTGWTPSTSAKRMTGEFTVTHWIFSRRASPILAFGVNIVPEVK